MELLELGKIRNNCLKRAARCKRDRPIRIEFVSNKLIRELMILPGRFVTHARRLVARIYVAPEWLEWWRVVYQQMSQRAAPTG